MTLPTMSNLTLTIGAAGVLILLYLWQRSHREFDLSDLITGDNGKVSATKFIQTATWGVTTWGFITLVQQGKMTEWYMAAYLGLAYGVKVVKDVMSGPPTPPPPPKPPTPTPTPPPIQD